MYIRTEDGRIIDPSKIVTGSKYIDNKQSQFNKMYLLF